MFDDHCAAFIRRCESFAEDHAVKYVVPLHDAIRRKMPAGQTWDKTGATLQALTRIDVVLGEMLADLQ